MTLALVLVRIGLGAVFAIAGVTKLADREGAARAAREFGLGRFAPLAAVIVPLVELALAATLVPATSARFAAGGAALLLAAFTTVIAVALAHGRQPDCHCFGKLQSSPAGPWTLLRNAGLAALAVLVAARPAPYAGWFELASSGVALLLAAQSRLAFTLLRRYGRALRRIEELETGVAHPSGLAAGNEAPAFTLPRLGGGEVTLRELLTPQRSLLLFFVDPHCGPCHALLPKLARWITEETRPVFISRGDLVDNAVFAEHGEVLVQRAHEVDELYAAFATPSAILVGPDGRVEQTLAVGPNAIEKLVRPRVDESSTTAVRQLTAAGAAVVAAGAATTVARGSVDRRSQRASDPDLQAIDEALKAAAPGLTAAARRSSAAIRAQATFKLATTVLRSRRTAARKALAAERIEVLAVRRTLKALKFTGTTSRDAYNAREFAVYSLDLLAQSIQKRAQAIGAAPKVRLHLIQEGQDLFMRSIGALSAAGKLLGY